MPDYLTTVTAQETIKGVAKSLVVELCRALGLPDGQPLPYRENGVVVFITTGSSAYGLEWTEQDGELYIFAEDNANTDEVPQEFWGVLARLLKSLDREYLTFTYANHCSKACPGSFGGGEFRLYNDGSVVFAEASYPPRIITQ